MVMRSGAAISRFRIGTYAARYIGEPLCHFVTKFDLPLGQERITTGSG